MNELTSGRGVEEDVTAAPIEARRSFARFRALLILGVTVLLLGIGYGTWSDIAESRRVAVDQALRQASSLIGSLEIHAASTIRVADVAAMSVARAVEETFGHRDGDAKDGTIPTIVKGLVSEDAPFRNLVVTDERGNIRYDVTGISKEFNIADREFFFAHQDRANVGMFISGLMRSRLGRGWFVAVSRRINKPNGAFGGVAYAVLDLSYFDEHYRGVDVGDFGFVTLWAKGGEVLARVPRDQKLIENPYAYAERITRLRGAEVVERTFSRSPIDGINRWIIAREVQGLPLRVSIGVAERDVLAAWERAVPRQIVMAVLTAVLVFSLAAVVLVYLGRLEAMTEAWRESERRSRTLFDSAFGFISQIATDGKVLSVNRAMETLAGEPAAELAGQAIWTLTPWSRSPGAMRQMRDAVRQAARGGFSRFESELMGASGPVAVDISVKPTVNELGVIGQLIVEARDVTDRKRAEDHLRASEARVRHYFDSAAEGIVVTNRAGYFIECNNATAVILGRDPSELVGFTMAAMLPEAPDPGRVAASHIQHVMELGAYRGELTLRRADGTLRAVEVSAARIDDDHYLGIYRDVTARRRDTEALKASNARVQALIQAMPDLVAVMDAEGCYIDEPGLNSDRLLLGLPPPRHGARVFDILPRDVATKILSAVTGALETRQVVTIEFPIPLPDGSRWFEARFCALPDELGPRPMVLQVTRDVTDRVEAAERLAAAKEEAEGANRAKSAFLATMSHELRTPLNAIIGFSEIMRSEMFGRIENTRYQGYLENIHESGSHLLALINDVLDVSKFEAGKYALEEEDLAISSLVDVCVALNEEAARRGGLILAMDVEVGLPTLRADQRAVRQILLNLVSNAIKFTPEGGSVTIRAYRHMEGGLAVAVADTGIGIPAEAFERIVTPFQQVDNSIARRFGGTGLGLAIVRNLMELHGGRLIIESEERVGTTMTVMFPRARLRGVSGMAI